MTRLKVFEQTAPFGIVQQYTLVKSHLHRWLEVPVLHLMILGLVENVSGGSYLTPTHVYLESGVDMVTFLNAAQAAGWRVEYRE